MTSAACCATVETASASQGRSLSWRRCATVVISPQTNPRRPTPIPDPEVMDWLRSGDIWQPDLAATEASLASPASRALRDSAQSLEADLQRVASSFSDQLPLPAPPPGALERKKSVERLLGVMRGKATRVALHLPERPSSGLSRSFSGEPGNTAGGPHEALRAAEASSPSTLRDSWGGSRRSMVHAALEVLAREP